MYRFHHIGVAVPSVTDALPMYRNLFGYELIAGPFDDPIQKVTVCFLRRPGAADDPMVELISSPHKDAPIQRILTKGGGAYHMCYEVDDLDQAFADMTAKGSLPLSKPVPATAFENRRIAWFWIAPGQMVELVEAAK